MTAPDARPLFVSGDVTCAVFHWNDAIAALQATYAQHAEPATAPLWTFAARLAQALLISFETKNT